MSISLLLYWMKPSFLNLFVKELTRDRVVPTISASIAKCCFKCTVIRLTNAFFLVASIRYARAMTSLPVGPWHLAHFCAKIFSPCWTVPRPSEVLFPPDGDTSAKLGQDNTGDSRNLKSFDEFLEKRFPESRRKAHYLMAIHENLTRIPKLPLRGVGVSKAAEMAKVARRDGKAFDCANWLHKANELQMQEFKREVERHLTRREAEAWGLIYFKVYKSQLPVIDGRRERGNQGFKRYDASLDRLFGWLSLVKQQEFLSKARGPA
jgi:hypothetical protein